MALRVQRSGERVCCYSPRPDSLLLSGNGRGKTCTETPLLLWGHGSFQLGGAAPSQGLAGLSHNARRLVEERGKQGKKWMEEGETRTMTVEPSVSMGGHW